MNIPHRGEKGSEYAQMVLYLEEWGFPIGKAKALDMFARRGDFRSIDYIHRVGTLEAWEINRPAIDAFKSRYPWATVSCCDAVVKIAAAREAGNRWDMIVADHPIKAFGHHFEHFDFLEDAFYCLNFENESVLIFNVMQEAKNANVGSHTYRAAWYGTHNRWLSVPFLQKFYTDYFSCRGGSVRNCVLIPQAGGYLVAIYHFDRRSELCQDRYLSSGITAQGPLV